MYLGVALRDRLPQIAALFAEGAISARLAATTVWHTDLIKDTETMRLVDTTLAEDAARFGPMSANKAAQAIDEVVDRYDPGALRRTRAGTRGRDVVISPADSNFGTAALWGSLFATDASVLDRRLTQMAHDVCHDDPRTIAQRRADALGALAAGADRRACSCGNADCQAALDADPRAAAVMIHVVADAAALKLSPIHTPRVSPPRDHSRRTHCCARRWPPTLNRRPSGTRSPRRWRRYSVSPYGGGADPQRRCGSAVASSR
jgi:hypothetical protein